MDGESSEAALGQKAGGRRGVTGSGLTWRWGHSLRRHVKNSAQCDPELGALEAGAGLCHDSSLRQAPPTGVVVTSKVKL